jgi:hypothetical protein
MRSVDQIQGDRRAARHYECETPLQFVCKSGETQYTGSGCTADLGRREVQFVSDTPLPAGAEVELRIEWPFLLQGVCPLELRMWGRVLRSDDRRTVVTMRDYEFHTCGSRSFNQASSSPATWSIVA